MNASAATLTDSKKSFDTPRPRTTSSDVGVDWVKEVPNMTEINTAVSKQWRPVIIWSSIAVTSAVFLAIITLFWAIAVTNQRQETVEATRRENQELHDQVNTNTKQTECRSRITNAAEAIRAERDSLGWQSLVDRATVATPEEVALRVRQMTDLNRQLMVAVDLRTRSIEICAQNAEFTPPAPAAPTK